MSELSDAKCVACLPGTPPLTADETQQLLREVPQWNVTRYDGVPHLERTFTFGDFVSALAFTNHVGELAETEGHHPAILTEWGRVRVSWWTHAIGGLHRNDFIMAAKTDKLVEP